MGGFGALQRAQLRYLLGGFGALQRAQLRYLMGGFGALQRAQLRYLMGELCQARLWDSSQAITSAAESAGLRPVVSIRISGSSGGSYGSESPVNSGMSPARALA